jgi:hypothetical protein
MEIRLAAAELPVLQLRYRSMWLAALFCFVQKLQTRGKRALPAFAFGHDVLTDLQ